MNIRFRSLAPNIILHPSTVNTFGSTLLATLTLCASGLSAMDLQTLVDRSPFAPAGGAAVANNAPEQPGTLEFRGIVVDEQGTSYSVFDATASRGYWLREGAEGPIRFKSYNAQDTQLEVEQNGRPVKLQMKRATIQAGSPIVMAAPRPANSGPQPGGGPSVARAPGDPATDARRLEAVAAEVRRRRALRNAAATGNAAPAASPAVVTPAPATQ